MFKWVQIIFCLFCSFVLKGYKGFREHLVDTKGIAMDWNPTAQRVGGFYFYAGTSKESDIKLHGTNKYHIQSCRGFFYLKTSLLIFWKIKPKKFIRKYCWQFRSGRIRIRTVLWLRLEQCDWDLRNSRTMRFEFTHRPNNTDISTS